MISPSLLRYHMEGLSKFITILPGGGLANLLQYYNGGGVSRDPKFVLRNIWTAPYRPVLGESLKSSTSSAHPSIFPLFDASHFLVSSLFFHVPSLST